MSIPTVTPDQIVRLIPCLATNHDGEVIATARAINRGLTAAGLDFHDLASAIQKAPEVRVVYREPDRKPYGEWQTGWGDIARWCRDNDRGRLSPTERGFINDMASRLVMGAEPTERQAEWLRAINGKLHRMESAA